MSWRQATIIGFCLGVALGASAYLFLTMVGNSIEREDRQLDYEFLRMSPALVWADDGCGLSDSKVCNSIEYVQSYVLPTNELKAVKSSLNASNVPYCATLYYDNGITCGLRVITSESMQPFGMSAEDDWTPTMELQPTDPSKPVVTMNGVLLQDATAHVQ